MKWTKTQPNVAARFIRALSAAAQGQALRLQTAAIFGLISLVPFAASAQIMTSTNYKIPFDAFSDGGGHSTSTNYITEDTITEQGSPTGEDLSSPNYLACVGYECLFPSSPFITAVLATSASPCTATTTGGTLTAPLGTLSTSSVSTAPNYICEIVSTNAASVVVQGRDAFAALESTSAPTATIPSSTATLTAGTQGYGYCSSNAQNGFAAVSPFNGACDTSTNHSVGGITTSNQTIWSATGPVTSAFGELLTKAAVSGTTPAHDDYADTLTLIVTGTF